LSLGMQPGDSGARGNSQCLVDGNGSWAGGDVNTLTLNLALSFMPTFAGNQVIYAAARDLHGNNSGWLPLGTWGVPGLTTFPSVVGVVPARLIGSGGPASTLAFTFTDANGWRDLGTIDILINEFLDGRQACYVAYQVATNLLYLVNDAGTGLEPALPLNGSGTTGNSQCQVNGAASSVNANGNTLILTVSLTFLPPFDGQRVIYAAARSYGDVNNSGWQAIGAWTVQ
jgi:hypothetical protein